MSSTGTSADREVEFGLLGAHDSESDDRDPQGAASAGFVVRVAGAVILSVALAGAASLGGVLPSRSGILTADEGHLISESHFSQSCSWKCNHKFWGKGDDTEYTKCCENCPGSTCSFPCTDACRQKREKKSAGCNGDAACMKLVQEEHTQCCSRCPGSTCVAKESEDALVASEEVADDIAQGAERAESNSEVAKTCGGNAAGAACQFPFEYQGLQYTACTSTNSDQPWCYTSGDGKWGNCKCLPS